MRSAQGKVRITGGSLLNRCVPVLNFVELKPTTDRVRESLFSTLASMNAIEGAVVLDLFAGSGVLGFEALSRGAARALFVEKQHKLIEQIQQSAQALGVVEKSKVIEGVIPNILTALALETELKGPPPLIFSDAPYAHSSAELPSLLFEHGILREGALLVLETSSKAAALPDLFLQLEKDRNYGDSSVRIYRFRGDAPIGS